MIRWIVFIFSLFSARVYGADDPVPNMQSVLRVIGRFGISHACAVTDSIALSAAHVLDPFPSAQTGLFGGYYQDYDGNIGRVDAFGVSADRDLGVFNLAKGVPFKPSKIALRSPYPGERIWIRGYELRNKKAALSMRLWHTKVLQSIAGHLILEDPVDHGTSGGCAYDERGDLVGIASSQYMIGNRRNDGFIQRLVDAELITIVVGIWGDLVSDIVNQKQ